MSDPFGGLPQGTEGKDPFELLPVSDLALDPSVFEMLPDATQVDPLAQLEPDPSQLADFFAASAVFAPDVISSMAPRQALLQRVKPIGEVPGMITFEDAFRVTRDQLEVPRRVLEIKPLKVPPSGLRREIANLVVPFVKHPIQTINSIALLTFSVTWNAGKLLAEETPLPEGLEEYRQKLTDFIGTVPAEQKDEAHRAFSALLASFAVAGGLGLLSGEAVFARIARARAAGTISETAEQALIKQALLEQKTLGSPILRSFTGRTLVAGAAGGTFGFFEAEKGDRVGSAVALALAAAPFGFILKYVGPKGLTRIAVEGIRSSHAAQLRGARPFDIETEQVPTAAEGVRLGARVKSFIRADLDLAATIIENAKTDPQQMAVVPGVETPGRSLALVRKILGEEGVVSVYKRPDGLFDVLVGDKESPLNTNANKQQFAREGFFEGMELIVDGRPMQYVGQSREPGRINVSRPGQPGFTQVAREDARRAPSVKGVSIGTPVEEIVGPALVLEGGKVVVGHRGEIHGDIFLRLAEKEKGLVVDESGFATNRGRHVTREEAREIAERSSQVSARVLRMPRPEILTEQQRLPLHATNLIAFDESVPLRAPRVRGRVQGPPPGRENLTLRDVDLTVPRPVGFVELEGRPAPVSALANILSPEEFKTFLKLGNELFPEGVAKPEGFLENIAASNNMVVGRSNAGAFIIGDNLTGEVLFRAKTFNEARDFINKSGQYAAPELVEGLSPEDMQAANAVGGPPAPGPRINEPFDIAPRSRVAMFFDHATVTMRRVFQFKPWARSFDNLHATRITENVYIPTQEGIRNSAAFQGPFNRRIEAAERILKKAKIPFEKWEQITDYRLTLSAQEIREGKLLSRKLNTSEISAAEFIAEHEINVSRVNTYIRLRDAVLQRAKQKGKIKAELGFVDETKAEMRRAVNRQMSRLMNMSDVELRAADLFDFIRKNLSEDIDLYAVQRLGNAMIEKSPTRAEYAARENMSPVLLKAALDLDAIWNEVAKAKGLSNVDARLLQAEITHVGSERAGTVEAAFLNQARETGVLGAHRSTNILSTMVKNGEIDVYDRQPFHTAARFVRATGNSIYLDGPWQAAAKYVRDTFRFRDFRPEGAAKIEKLQLGMDTANKYLANIRGNPDAAVELTRASIGQVLKQLDIDMPENVVTDFVNSFLAVSNSALMGWRFGLGFRDGASMIVFYYSRFGKARTAEIVRMVANIKSETMKALREQGKIPTISPIDTMSAEEFYRTTEGKHLKGLPSYLRRGYDYGVSASRKLGQAGLKGSLQPQIYELGHAAAYMETRGLVLRELSKVIEKGERDYTELSEKIDLHTYDNPTQRHFLELVDSRRYEEAADMLALQTGREVIGNYGNANHALGWGTNIGKLLTQYGTWPSWAVQFMGQGLTQGTRAQRMRFAGRLAMTQAAIAAVGLGLGLNLNSWYLMPAFFYTGGPAFQSFQLVTSAFTGFAGEKDIAKARLRRLIPTFEDPRSLLLPGSYFINDVLLRPFTESETVFQMGGSMFSIPQARGTSVLEQLIQ